MIRLVREMLDAGTALAVIGSHELNAIHFHTKSEQTGAPLRPWSDKNLRQHQSFLNEFPPGSADTQEAVSWMRPLPLFKWWSDKGRTWADIAMSVPDPLDLPMGQLPEHVAAMTYPASAKPVLFGHYWMTGTLVLQAPNAFCLDYSAGKDGPLISYQLEGDGHLTIENASCHSL